MIETDVLIIGAGPSGTVAAALLNALGHRVIILEKTRFPRFSIGESLLPQSMEFIEKANLLSAVTGAGFQLKNGAVFTRDNALVDFDFREKSSAGWATTYQVIRADFDHLLALEVEKQGVSVCYEHEILEFDYLGERARLAVRKASGKIEQYVGRFVLDASGFGRVLPRLLGLERPSGFPVRRSLFTHVADHITEPTHDREKILIAVHPHHRDVWYWLIPFSNGRSSLGVVATERFFSAREGSPTELLRCLISEEPRLALLLQHAEFDTPVREISGYAADVSSLCGPGYALLGNAGEFLDPVFSSGVTIAMKSASLASAQLNRFLGGQPVDWAVDFEAPLRKGVSTFRAFVEAWYDGRFQDIVFFPAPNPRIKRLLCSVLAGYAWDEQNPYVVSSERRISALAELCRAQR